MLSDADPAAEIAAGWALEDTTRAWGEVCAAVIAEGGIRANADYSAAESMPPALYRAGGNAADDVAWRLGYECAGHMLDLAWRLFDRCQEAQREAARMRRTAEAAQPRGQRGKLSLEDARVIRELVAVGESRRALADAWGVNVSTIGDIVRGRYLRAEMPALRTA
jgi:hypothetical protein